MGTITSTTATSTTTHTSTSTKALCGLSWAPVFDQDNRGAAYQFPHDPTISPIVADWSVMNSHIVQDAASFPTAFVSPIMTAGLELETTVSGTELDGGFFGLVFGFESSSSFHVAQWKYAAADNADLMADYAGFYGARLGDVGGNLPDTRVYYSTAGLVLKRYFNSPSNYSLWTTNSTSSNTLVTGPIDFSREFMTLYDDATRSSWNLNEQYVFRVSYRPKIGYIRVWVTDTVGNVVQDTGDLFNQASTSANMASFGLWSFLQPAAFENTVYKCCDGIVTDNGCIPYTTCKDNEIEVKPATSSTDRICQIVVTTTTATSTSTSTSTSTATTTSTSTSTSTTTTTPTHHYVSWPQVQVLNVLVGESVTWTWDVDANAHTLTSSDPAWSVDTNSQLQGFTFTYQFTDIGMYPYFDKNDNNFFGTVYVDMPTTTTSLPSTEAPIIIHWGQTATPGLVTVVTVGQTVLWKLDLDNSPHTITHTSFSPLFDSGSLTVGQQFSFKFYDVGVFPFHDALNTELFGQITVVPIGYSTTATFTTATVTTTPTPTSTTASPIIVSWPTFHAIFVNVGDTVVWILNSDDQMHTITSTEVPPVFSSGPLSPGDSFRYQFQSTGLYSYVDEYNPESIIGLVVVGFPTPSLQSTTVFTTTAANAPVAIVPWGFSPPQAAVVTTILVGQTIRWVLSVDQSPHTITSVSTRVPPNMYINSPLLQPGQSFDFTFPQIGTVTYWDSRNHKIAGIVKVLASLPTTTTAVPTSTTTSTTTRGMITWPLPWPSSGKTLSILVGDSVEWQLSVDPVGVHSIYDNSGSVNSGDLLPHATFSVPFPSPGLFIFFDAESDAYSIVIATQSGGRRRSIGAANLL